MPRKTKTKNNNRKRLNPGSNPPSRQGSNISDFSMVSEEELVPRTFSEFQALEDIDTRTFRTLSEERDLLENYRRTKELERRENATLYGRAQHALEVSRENAAVALEAAVAGSQKLAEDASMFASQASTSSANDLTEVAIGLARNALSTASMYLGLVDSVENSVRAQEEIEIQRPPSLQRK